MLTVSNISQLTAAIESIQQRTGFGGDQSSSSQTVFIPTGWPSIDHVLGGGLRNGAVHEWFGLAMPNDPGAAVTHSIPPLAILIHLAWQAIDSASRDSSSLILWIGKHCWPHPRAMARPIDPSRADSLSD